MTDLKNTRRGGFYFKARVPHLSITEALRVINKPQIVYWFGREVYFAMVKDPTLDERTALSAPYLTSKSATDRGITVHSIVEAFKTSGARLENVPEQFRGYANAFYSFMDALNPKILEQEKTLFNDEHKIAGTMDMLVKIGNKTHLLDVKTGKDIYPEVELQLSAYAFMLRAGGTEVDNISALLLETGQDGKPTGNYKFATLTENFDAFLAAKKLYEWSNKDKLDKVGYNMG